LRSAKGVGEHIRAIGVDPRRVIIAVARTCRLALGLPDVSMSLAAVPPASSAALEPLQSSYNVRFSNDIDRKWNLQDHTITCALDLQARHLESVPSKVLLHAVQKHSQR
jgi:hypothetical protein